MDKKKKKNFKIGKQPERQVAPPAPTQRGRESARRSSAVGARGPSLGSRGPSPSGGRGLRAGGATSHVAPGCLSAAARAAGSSLALPPDRARGLGEHGRAACGSDAAHRGRRYGRTARRAAGGRASTLEPSPNAPLGERSVLGAPAARRDTSDSRLGCEGCVLEWDLRPTQRARTGAARSALLRPARARGKGEPARTGVYLSRAGRGAAAVLSHQGPHSPRTGVASVSGSTRHRTA